MVDDATSSLDMCLLCFPPSAHALALISPDLFSFIIVIRFRASFLISGVRSPMTRGSKVSYLCSYPNSLSSTSSALSPYLLRPSFMETYACLSSFDNCVIIISINILISFCVLRLPLPNSGGALYFPFLLFIHLLWCHPLLAFIGFPLILLIFEPVVW